MLHANRTIHARARGFSIVELMVAMIIGLILLAGVLTVMYSSKVTYLENERVGRNQENGRAALELIARDLRAAGFPGCSQPIPMLLEIKNRLNDPGALMWNLTEPVFGYEATGAAWNVALDPVLPSATPGSDIIAVRTTQAGMPAFRASAAVAALGPFTVEKADSETVQAPQPMVISDCQGASIFVATGFAPGAGSATIAHGVGGGEPSNAMDSLGYSFKAGAHVAPIDTVVYYVRQSQTGTGPALWRVTWSAAGGAVTPRELIPGVEMLQILYGEDTDGNTRVDQYVRANEVANWSDVISVQIAILVRSLEQNAPVPDTQPHVMLQDPNNAARNFTVPAFNDRYQRAVFSTTITLRNRTT